MKKITILVILLSLILGACGNKSAKPVTINEETAKCEICNMAVADNQFATQVVLESGKAYLFDDIGCMFEWFSENDTKEIAGSFVRDYHTSEWIEMEDATYVYDQNVRTPMAYNVISFIKEADAKSYINNNHGNLLKYDDLKKHAWPVNQEMKEMNKMEHKKQHGN
nr:nitrous oxide reductase accessory protein NosL [Bacillus kwashiorkori]